MFSLQAIASVRFSDTMQLQVPMGSTFSVVLLDSGSTQNILSEDAAQRTGIPLQRHPCLTATVANGERVSCVGILRQAAFSIHDTPFKVALYVMSLIGFDMVLGPSGWQH